MVRKAVLKASHSLCIVVLPPSSHMACDNQLKVLVTSKRHMVISTNISVNRMARWLDRNMVKYTGGGNIIISEMCGESDFIGLLSMHSVQHCIG
jgi:hypothetical protein